MTEDMLIDEAIQSCVDRYIDHWDENGDESILPHPVLFISQGVLLPMEDGILPTHTGNPFVKIDPMLEGVSMYIRAKI